jgi:hypothetical protein
MVIEWNDGASIRVTITNGEALVSANRDGLKSLAAQLNALAEEEQGSHIHYDAFNALEDGSNDLIIELV